MAQAQLNDPPLHQETSLSDQTSISDQTSHLDITRPPDPPDPSLSLRSDEQSSLSLSPARATGCLYNDFTMQFFNC